MKAVILDMDGTMVDNMMVHHRAWQQTLAKYGLEMTLEQVHKEIHGVNTEILARLFNGVYTEEEQKMISLEKEEIYRSEYREELVLLPGLMDFMEGLRKKNIALAVASAAPPENVDFVLDTLGIRNMFQSVLHSRDVINGKPHPEIYLKSAELLGASPADCLVFEDSPTGVRAAAAANSPVMVVTTTHEPREFDGIQGVKGYIKNFTDPKIQELLAI